MRQRFNVYLDDVRDCPHDDFVVVRTVAALKDFILNNPIEILSLDHDLGMEPGIPVGKAGLVIAPPEKEAPTGADFLRWILEQLSLYNRTIIQNLPTMFTVHSANPVGVKNMMNLIEDIGKFDWIKEAEKPANGTDAQ